MTTDHEASFSARKEELARQTLLPCPFCGVEHPYELGDHPGYYFHPNGWNCPLDDVDGFTAEQWNTRAALSSPRVPVIDGLEDDISFVSGTLHWMQSAEYDGKKAVHNVVKAARAYAALPKMQKVDLDVMRIDPKRGWTNEYETGYNAAIDDIEAKYGELYAEVK